MIEFKVSPDLLWEISDFKSSGDVISASFTAANSSGVDTLTTAMAFIAEQKKIKDLLDLYVSFVAKDAEDMNAMVATAQNADKALFGVHK